MLYFLDKPNYKKKKKVVILQYLSSCFFSMRHFKCLIYRVLHTYALE